MTSQGFGGDLATGQVDLQGGAGIDVGGCEAVRWREFM